MKGFNPLTCIPIRIFVVFLLFLEVTSSCNYLKPSETKTPLPSVTPSSTPPPSYTPTPFTEKVYLLTSDEISQTVDEHIQSTLNELAQLQGIELYTFENQTPLIFEPGTRVLIFLPPDRGISALSNQNLDVQFVGIGIPGLDPTSNLNIIGPGGFQEEQIAFIAGYTAAVMTKEYRVGIIYQGSIETQDSIQQSFSNGVVYYCGLCQQTYPPYYDYPILTSLSEGATEAQWVNAIDLLLDYSVQTVFIYSDSILSSVLERCKQNNIKLLGIVHPVEGYEDAWAASIRFAPESILVTHWDDIMNHKGGWIEEIPIILDDVNENLLSTGRIRWIQEIIEDVIHGFIETGNPK